MTSVKLALASRLWRAFKPFHLQNSGAIHPVNDNISQLDSFDLRILDALQENALSTADMLSTTIPLSPSAIARRVRRLRRDNLIEDVAVVSPALAGSRLFTVIDIQLDVHAPAQGLDDLLRRLDASPHVSMVMEVSGDFDLLVIASTKGMQEYNEFADTVIAEHPVVRRYESRFVKKWRKRTLRVPMSGNELLA